MIKMINDSIRNYVIDIFIIIGVVLFTIPIWDIMDSESYALEAEYYYNYVNELEK